MASETPSGGAGAGAGAGSTPGTTAAATSSSSSDATVPMVAEAKQFIAWDPNDGTRAEAEALLKAHEGGDSEGLSAAFGKRISFGTAGLRSRMAAGISNMNDLVVLQTTQGLCKYLLDQFGDDAKARGIVVGYDHRTLGSLSSSQFANVTAAVALASGFKVYLFSDIVATPLVPFLVKRNKCVAGVMVTASHNPKEDNGFKVYWANAAQIIKPHDKGIATSIEANLEPWQKYDLSDIASKCVDQRAEAGAEYLSLISDKLCRHKDANAASPVKIVYSAMHGVGQEWTLRAFKAFNLPAPTCVKEQGEPDPTFPTVAFPNPEEGKSALQLSMATADAAGATLILANDPDADRLALAEKQSDGSWKVFNGNELGVTLAHWQWTCLKKENPDLDPKDVVMLTTTVSSKMLGAMARVEGFGFEDTLTGFKWLCNRAEELEAEGKVVPFCYEQAIGFSCLPNLIPDKDGVSAAAVVAEMAGQLAAAGQSVTQYYDSLRERYGYFLSVDHYLVCSDDAITASIFERLRNNGHYWHACGGFPIRAIRDLTTSCAIDTNFADGKPRLPTTSSPMITYYFQNGAIVTLRTSGTEPKVKYYTELGGDNLKTVAATLAALHEAIVHEMYEPAKNGLEVQLSVTAEDILS